MGAPLTRALVEGPGNAFYFEVLVAHTVAGILAVPTNVDRDRLVSMAGLENREPARAVKASELIGRHVRRSKRVPREVIWIGAAHSARGIAADIRVDFADGTRSHYQLKSVISGKGTIRNLGLESLEQYFAVDLHPLVARALRSVIRRTASTSGERGSRVASFGMLRTSRSQLKGAKLTRYDAVAKVAYAPYKRRMTEMLTSAFNDLPLRQRSKVVLEMLGIVTGEETYLVIHDRYSPRLYSTEKLVTYLGRGDLHAESQPPGNSLVIRTKDTRLFRLNSSATNHQGLSDPCARLFFLKGSAELLTSHGLPADVVAGPGGG